MKNQRLDFDPNLITALGPGAPDDGDAGRKQRGMAIAALAPIRESGRGYKVPSQSGKGTYYVLVDRAEPYCSCPDFEERPGLCKHIYAVQMVVKRRDGQLGLGADLETLPTGTTYGQPWALYNAAQEHEQEHFATLLRDLCSTIEQPPASGTGRPRLPLSDVVFAASLKVYGGFSTRRAMTGIRSANTDGLIAKAPSVASLWKYMEDPALTPVLKQLIEQSAIPLAAVEHDFAIDSTGFGTSVYGRYFDHKWGRPIRNILWVKAHAICGVKTNIITQAEATATPTNDTRYLAPFVEATARHFNIEEVSADKAYLSRANVRAVEAVGARAYIPLKAKSRPVSPDLPRDSQWERYYHYVKFNSEEFSAHYHKRSNVESTFSMVKNKYGASVRSRTPVAQVNEVLLKFLCHNISVLIHASYELGMMDLLIPRQTASA